MNFSLISPGDNDYNKIMMKQHWDQKKRRKQETVHNFQNVSSQNTRLSNTTQSLPKAGQAVLNSQILNAPYAVYSPRKKIINEQNEKMKRFMKDQLQQSLADHQSLKVKNNEEEKKIKKAMSVQNGMLDYLEKQIQKRDNFIKTCLVKQEMNQSKFLDQDLRKRNKIESHVLQNIDPNRFCHEAEKYEQDQKQYSQKVKEINKSQIIEQRSMRQQQISDYRRYLDKKYVPTNHNPITNPLQYYIENPYIRKQLQKY